MEKQKTTVRVAGKDYTLVSSDPPAYMHRVAAYVDRKLQETSAAARIPAGQAAVLATFNMADELMKAQDENSRIRRELMAVRAELEALKAASAKE